MASKQKIASSSQWTQLLSLLCICISVSVDIQVCSGNLKNYKFKKFTSNFLLLLCLLHSKSVELHSHKRCQVALILDSPLTATVSLTNCLRFSNCKPYLMLLNFKEQFLSISCPSSSSSSISMTTANSTQIEPQTQTLQSAIPPSCCTHKTSPIRKRKRKRKRETENRNCQEQLQIPHPNWR